MGNFTFEEMNLMCIYNTGSRTGLIDSSDVRCAASWPRRKPSCGS